MSGRPVNSKTALLDAQRMADEVVDITKQNLNKVLERDHNITSLSDKADQLASSSNHFKKTSNTLKWNFWWHNVWYRACCIFWVVAIIATVVIVVVLDTKK
mmetsp:Transcript_5917/g.15064  ORF Transcript_5917/g.15064 Transcript_5917/m.15064 type:complete len:101 (+) Transcript_5917:43-345(+)|eukprot:CAMPEP_0182925874 /NCGR_PEP_ID=MMETSP0105_2-20130417/10708_1 /TAXON_ID=81532 ORGANISM="Acanthoeca-like sp., Strain 10tr" /NCGR_SAMPLE_ID=MMETSP0105_2 /ASSEMBLY_ACC=CAM_ASM_000205 /LENGTH=100 /DNA_ID=CAMNT_0025063741 /DNA_START=43 /DNA_END=345 /DNA_ORIENTATION=+